jgi:hypothetical protein
VLDPDVLNRLRALAGDCATASVWSHSDDELRACLDVLQATQQALTAATAHVIREIDGRCLPAKDGATSTAVWLRWRQRISIHAAKHLVELAQAIDRRPALDTALTGGAVNTEQAQVIATALGNLPDQAGAETVEKAEEILVGFAADYEPTVLRKLGARILTHVDPDLAEKAEQEALEREDARAHEGRAFTLTPTRHGRVRVTGWLDREAAAIVNAALDPLCSPYGTTAEDDRTPTQRRADAIVEICQLALHTEQLPEHGGERPHVVVTVPFDVLRGQLGAGTLDTGEALSATQVRRIACDALIIPAVLGSDGQVLDLGMSRRLFTGAVRRALVLRDGGCAFPACDRPARWCQGHHVRSWSAGGPTSLDNGCLLCGHHHRLVHQSDWEVRIAADGRPEFIPPAYLDPQRHPRRNTYHRRT